MAAKRADPRRIKVHRAYAIDEAARALGVHKHTVRNWIADGLPVADRSKPMLLHGHELRAYLESARKAAKRPCSPGTLYCFKCDQPRRPALGMIEAVPRNITSGNLRALCEECGTMMHRCIRLAEIALKMPGLQVQIPEAGARLLERAKPTLNCD